MAADAHPGAAGLAWSAVALSALVLAVGLVLGSGSAVHISVGLLGVLLLLRAEDRLLLAPLYGGGLLLIDEVAMCSVELRETGLIAAGVTGSRLGVAIAAAGGGTCAAALVAAAVLVAPARSVAVTAAGAVAVLAATGTVLALARGRRQRAGASEAET